MAFSHYFILSLKSDIIWIKLLKGKFFHENLLESLWLDKKIFQVYE